MVVVSHRQSLRRDSRTRAAAETRWRVAAMISVLLKVAAASALTGQKEHADNP
jgi:hypothetical protein